MSEGVSRVSLGGIKWKDLLVCIHVYTGHKLFLLASENAFLKFIRAPITLLGMPL